MTRFWLLTSTPWPFLLKQSRLSFPHFLEWQSSHWQKYMHRHESMCYSFHTCLLIKYLGSSVAQAARLQAVTELPTLSSQSGATSPGGAHTNYQMYKRPFGSSSGSSYMTWYFSRSDSSIQLPPRISQSEPGHLYVHFDTVIKSYQYWMLAGSGQWECVNKGAEYPHNHDRVLSIRSNGEPSWVLRATIGTTEIRRERRAASIPM